MRITFQLLERGVEPRGEHRRVLGYLGDERLRVLRMRRDLALAVHVQREADIPGLGEAPRLVARVVVVPPPLVYDEHAGALARRGVVPGDEALQHGVALAVFDLTRLHVGAPRR